MYLQPLKHLDSVSLGINLFSVEVSVSYFKAQCLHRFTKVENSWRHTSCIITIYLSNGIL